MTTDVRRWFDLPRLLDRYQRRLPLVLVNGLAEQPESWFTNRVQLSRHFDVKVPEILVYDGPALHRHIESGGVVDVDYLTDRLEAYLDEFVQRPPYHLAASSLGCQVVVNYAVRRPERVARLVLIGASGFYGDENLPLMVGVRRSDHHSLIRSVFHHGHFASEDLVQAFRRKFEDRKWKLGVLRTLRGTVGHSVAALLPRIEAPTLAIWGADDHILSDVAGSIRSAARIPIITQVVIPRCGHAPQIEKARLVNPLISRFLRGKLQGVHPALDARGFLASDQARGDRARVPAIARTTVI